MTRAAIIGASGAIGGAFARLLAARPDVECVFAFSRSGSAFEERGKPGLIDLLDEDSVAAAAEVAAKDGALDLVIVAVGLLHEEQ